MGIFSCSEVTDKAFFASRGLAVYGGGTKQNWGVGFVEDDCSFLEVKNLFFTICSFFSEGEWRSEFYSLSGVESLLRTCSGICLDN